MGSQIRFSGSDASKPPDSVLDAPALWSSTKITTVRYAILFFQLAAILLLTSIFSYLLLGLNDIRPELCIIVFNCATSKYTGLATYSPILVWITFAFFCITFLFTILRFIKNRRIENRLIKGYWLQIENNLVNVWKLEDLSSAEITGHGGQKFSIKFVGEKKPGKDSYNLSELNGLLSAFAQINFPYELAYSAIGLTISSDNNILWKGRRGFYAAKTLTYMGFLVLAIPVVIATSILINIWIPLPSALIDFVGAIIATSFFTISAGVVLFAGMSLAKESLLDRFVDIFGTVEISDDSIRFCWPMTQKLRRAIPLKNVVDAVATKKTNNQGSIALSLPANSNTNDLTTVSLIGMPDYMNALAAIKKAAGL